MPLAKETINELHRLLEMAIEREGAVKGNIQIFEPETESLRILVHIGFGAEFLSYFEVVKAFDSSACGRAAGIGNVVLVEDVETDRAFLPHRRIARRAGFRSVKSIPVFGSAGGVCGILSLHSAVPRTDEVSDGVAELARRVGELLRTMV